MFAFHFGLRAPAARQRAGTTREAFLFLLFRKRERPRAHTVSKSKHLGTSELVDPPRAPKQYTLFMTIPAYDVEKEFSEVNPAMAASQVVLYFDRQEDALQFTLAASSIIADGAALRETALKVAKEVCKATRITAEGSLNSDGTRSKKHV